MKYIFIFIFSFPLLANEAYINFDQKFMDADWSFLPEVPSSFSKNSSNSIETGFSYKKIQGSFLKNDIELLLDRATEPKKISLNAKKERGSIGYSINDSNLVYISYSTQIADQQTFSCYEFSGFILGGCENATFTISSSNPKYNDLGSNIISIDGNTKTFSLGFERYINNFWLNSFSFEVAETKYDYNWISPIEEIKSPILLNLSINGIVLGDAIETALSRLPQKNQWQSQQINFGLKQKFKSIYNFNIIGEYDLVILDFKNYSEYKKVPKYNLKIRAGLEIYLKNISLTFYGDLYKNNLIGFEPITFNQRTEHYFEKTYGELGLILNLKF
tara:strand:- start:2043 stop:3035 length:993 start_codon:yes stop_codon:yes gene_type:complete